MILRREDRDFPNFFVRLKKLSNFPFRDICISSFEKYYIIERKEWKKSKEGINSDLIS